MKHPKSLSLLLEERPELTPTRVFAVVAQRTLRSLKLPRRPGITAKQALFSMPWFQVRVA
jgi:hypothetical protein